VKTYKLSPSRPDVKEKTGFPDVQWHITSIQKFIAEIVQIAQTSRKKLFKGFTYDR